ncbi:MAG: universal stress protein [Chlorobiota bacterium]|nr:universal stress protein [Chlorobiota bacterium]QQS66358.1 MAG: universal stress protein [Chlorobiota bacterium]
MITINRILCPVDFSDESKDTLQYAIEFARNSGAEIVLLNVLPSESMYSYDTYVVPMSVLESTRKSAEEELDKLALKVKSELVNSKIITEIADGNPADSITESAKRNETDLIIMSSHGRTGISRLLLGSVAELVLREAHCPVMVIKSSKNVKIV